MAGTYRCIAGAAVLSLAAWATPTPAQQKEAATRPAFEGPFQKPTAVCDQDGKPILTRRAVAHPAVADWNADGRNDILLGCHKNMDTAAAEIRVLLNVGTKESPRFRWPTKELVRLEGQPRGFSVSCGCKSSGTFELHPMDWNGDGRFDLVVNTYWSTDGVRLLLNGGKSAERPTFVKDRMLHRIGSHGKGSGGGDWNQDGVADLVFPVNAYGWAVYPGSKSADGGVKFADKPAFSSGDFRLVGQDRWFDHSPYAWNFSGKRPAGAKAVEIVAVMEDPGNARRKYSEHLCHVNYYLLDRQARTCTLRGTLATNKAAHTRLGIGDLNGDGSMDVLYTGGAFSRGEETQIWVMYGKAQNVPPAASAHRKEKE